MKFDYDIEFIESLIYPHIHDKGGLQETVYKAMNEAIRAGGKRIRPILMWEAYKLFAKEDAEAVAAFMAAIEMIHTGSLIHDDLPCIDNDALRRGKPSTWASFGEDMAVLSGDALFIGAFEVVSKDLVMKLKSNTYEYEYIRAAIEATHILAEKSGMSGMIAGEVIDVEYTSKPIDKAVLNTIYKLKTQALIEAALMIGAKLALASDEEVSMMERIAADVGLAFQIQDDILDISSSEEELGKPICSDEKNKKTTYVSLYGLDKAKEEVSLLSKEAIRLLDSLGRDADTLKDIIEMLIDRKN